MGRTSRHLLTAAAVVGLSATAMPAANATPGSGVSGVTILQKTIGDTEYIVQRVTIQPGGTSGWHYHTSDAFGIVEQGELVHYSSDCAVDGVYRQGQVMRERGGPDSVHFGRNPGSTPAVMLAFYYEHKVGTPLTVDAPNPGCDF